ncbi:hypothetical protein [Parapedobacter koreensis]|uniref:Uncharacterized protein n=1 Tax=Parapedobacter koreensis TaxID=332977 RepID=A0A1H7K492_9SPHI|nr:hypothetical protein [Parapedobacter koreensis]SEK81270.1 hypothetical protein SAMN05421740_102768 [Parapedobacter koreensis]
MTEDKFVIGLTDVKTEAFTINEPSDDIINSFDVGFLNVGVDVYFNTDADNNKVTIHLAFSYDYGDDASGDLLRLFHYKGSFAFELDDLKSLISPETKNVRLPGNVLERLLDLSISTARGIIIAKSTGSFINKYYLPVFDVTRLLKDDMDIE